VKKAAQRKPTTVTGCRGSLKSQNRTTNWFLAAKLNFDVLVLEACTISRMLVYTMNAVLLWRIEHGQ